MNNKRLKYVQQKVEARKSKLLNRFLIVMICLFGSLAVYSAVSEPQKAIENISMISGTGTLAMGAMATIKGVSDSEVVGNALGYEVYFLPVADINKKTFPKVGPNREVPDIQMLPGKYMHYFEGHTVPTYIASGTKEAGAIVLNATNTFSMVVGGFRDQISDFIEDYAGTKFVILFKDCETGTMLGMGSICKPVTFSTYEYKNDADGRYATFTFTQQTVQQPWKYVGTIVEQDPVTVAADATSIPIVSDNSQYIISNGTAAAAAINAVTGLTEEDKGRTITLIGNGTDHPSTIADGTPFILVDGATWTASEGATLSLRVLDMNTLVEISRA